MLEVIQYRQKKKFHQKCVKIILVIGLKWNLEELKTKDPTGNIWKEVTAEPWTSVISGLESYQQNELR